MVDSENFRNVLVQPTTQVCNSVHMDLHLVTTVYFIVRGITVVVR